MSIMSKTALLSLALLASAIALTPVALAANSSWLRGSLDPASQQTGNGGKLRLRDEDAAYAAFQEGKYLTALKEAKKLAAKGRAHAHTLIGLLYDEGLGVTPNPKLAAQHYKKGAELGDENAKIAYGILLAKGEGVPQNEKLAAHYLREPAENGHATAQYNLALLYMKGIDGPEDYAQAAYWLMKAAAQGHVQAAYDLGTLYAFGRGVAQDDVKAAQWIGRAADSGDKDAMLDYAILLFKGRGVPKNKALAVKYLARAAEKGNIVAQNRLARLYRTGIVENDTLILERDYIQAAKWHLIARLRGLSDARLDLFLASLRKDERQKADQAAAQWLKETLGR